MRLYRAVLTHTDIQITVRIWSTTDHDWTWTPLDTCLLYTSPSPRD